MPTRIAFKREIQKAMKRSLVLLKCTAVLLTAGLAVPALMCAYETTKQHRLALSRELHWKKWYSTDEFNWGNWPDARCQAITRFGRKALNLLVEVRCMPLLPRRARSCLSMCASVQHFFIPALEN